MANKISTYECQLLNSVRKLSEDIELPFFDLDTIVNATKNFCSTNMIGEGGFGPVYKGKLTTGHEIAVKRLLKNSGQDQNKGLELPWEKRFAIAMGISRGLLYLHQDSRLRIIHRDLKASNILLDDELSPKISDFGISRCFGRDQIVAKTKANNQNIKLSKDRPIMSSVVFMLSNEELTLPQPKEPGFFVERSSIDEET
ncbi:receptor-like serine/threonine-protein kinase SD1-8 [Cornus florida]|uniref:receptor-like serine/threonine-protein kinase SD1-8 n=1 Tax=Cornus florida TaxID=4283 RepID=UPI0028A2AA66|nr:receptor-like serine/threonine-protein kinase SD1-8 [Cornus florida]